MSPRLSLSWRVSLKDLIETAAAINVMMPDGSTSPLLPPLTGKKAGIVTEHRNLIHPRAEIRGAAPIDGSTLKTMQGVLEEVLRDLRRAHENGVLDEYAQGHVV